TYSLAVSSIKSMIGQPFSAGGVLQVVAATLASYHNVVPPTINLTTPDPKCDLDYVPNKPRSARVNHALVHSHSLGGHVPGSHSALVIGASRHIRGHRLASNGSASVSSWRPFKSASRC